MFPSVHACGIADVEAFIGVVHFMYNGPVYTAKELGFANTWRLLMLSDRFQVKSCTEYCIKALEELGIPGLDEAINLTLLRQSFTASAQLSLLMKSARTFLAQKFCPVVANSPKAADAEKLFLDLPEPGRRPVASL